MASSSSSSGDDAAVSDDLVLPTYRDAFERTRTVSPEARAAVMRAMGIDGEAPPEDDRSVAVVRPGERLPHPGEVVLEDGTSLGDLERLVTGPCTYRHSTKSCSVRALGRRSPG